MNEGILQTMRGGLAAIRAEITAARERRAAGDPDARKRVSALREEEEIAADRLALAEAAETERQRQTAETERAAAAKRRAAEVAATLDRHEALAVDVLAKARELRGAVQAIVDHTKGLQQSEGLDSYHLAGVMTRCGLAVTNTWPAHVSLLSARARHGWEDGWPAEERRDLAERLRAGA